MSKVLLVYEDYSEMANTQSVLKKVGFDVLGISNEFGLTQQMLSFNPEIVVGFGKGPKVSTIGVGRRLKEMPRWTGRVVLVFPAGFKPDPQDLLKVRMDMAIEAPLDITRLLQVLAQLTDQDPQVLVAKMLKTPSEAPAGKGPGGSFTTGGGGESGSDRVFVSGGRDEAEDKTVKGGSLSSTDTWAVKGSKEIEDFNRLMGLAPSTTPSPTSTTSSSSSQDASADPAALEPSSARLDESFQPDAARVSAQQELEQSQEKLKEKIESYQGLLKGLELSPVSTLRRADTRKAQKRLATDWKAEDLQKQDQLRRQFTQALFKKK